MSDRFFLETPGISREPVMLFKLGSDLIGTVLYTPSEILSVEIWNQEIGYQKSTEHEIMGYFQENGKIYIKIQSRNLPYLLKAEIIRKPGEFNSYPSTKDGKYWILHSEEGLFHTRQVIITYKHSGRWNG